MNMIRRRPQAVFRDHRPLVKERPEPCQALRVRTQQCVLTLCLGPAVEREEVLARPCKKRNRAQSERPSCKRSPSNILNNILHLGKIKSIKSGRERASTLHPLPLKNTHKPPIHGTKDGEFEVARSLWPGRLQVERVPVKAMAADAQLRDLGAPDLVQKM